LAFGGALALVVVACAACPAADEPQSADPCVTGRFRWSVALEPRDDLDLLFVIDDSGSMAEEQASIAAELPRLVRVLTTGDRTGDGRTVDDFEPVTSLHLGVLTGDMGTAGYAVPSCAGGRFGDDGLLRATGNTSAVGCAGTYPAFLDYEPSVSTQPAEQFGADFRCVAMVGTSGCNIEQPLEALLKALTPSTSPLAFSDGTRGHGDLENAGFLRPYSTAALVLVTDEDDCSIRDGAEEFFDEASPTYAGALDTRCHRYPSALWDVSRYIEGLRALRPGRESSLVFGAIVGVPVDLVTLGTPNYDAILSDPRMVETAAPLPAPPATTDEVGLEPSCDVLGVARAFPPRRVVEVARGFGANGFVQSICESGYAGALDAVVGRVFSELASVCLPIALERDPRGLVSCDIFVVIPPPGTVEGQPTSCAEVPGAVLSASRTRADGSIECKVAQLATDGGTAPIGAGWYYDDFTAHSAMRCGVGGQQTAFPPGGTPPYWTSTELECQLACSTSADCPLDWTCAPSAGGRFCIEPACTELAL
jgi:hypothetical protein